MQFNLLNLESRFLLASDQDVSSETETESISTRSLTQNTLLFSLIGASISFIPLSLLAIQANGLSSTIIKPLTISTGIITAVFGVIGAISDTLHAIQSGMLDDTIKYGMYGGIIGSGTGFVLGSALAGPCSSISFLGAAIGGGVMGTLGGGFGLLEDVTEFIYA